MASTGDTRTPRHSPDEGAPDVSVLIVGYNSASHIGACVGSIPLACREAGIEVLLVDQGDGETEKLVAREYPWVRIVPSKGNLGFAGGNNLLATNASGRNFLLLNPDVELLAGAIDRLVDAALEHPTFSAWGGVTLDPSGEPDIGNTVHVPSLKEMASRVFGKSSASAQLDNKFDVDEPVEALSGGFVLIDRNAWDEAGGLDERFFLYCEEVDFFYRLGLKGHQFLRVGSARAIHNIGHGEVASPTRSLYRAAGIMQFARLHWSPVRQTMAFFLIWLAALQRFVVGTGLGALGRDREALISANEKIALEPGLWRRGYDPHKGLLAKLRG